MKKIAFALGAIVCICVIAPKIVGGMVEDEYDYIAKRLSDDPSIEIVERSFTNRWFNGESITELKFKGISAELDGFKFIVTEQLSYGPVIFNESGLTMALAHSNADVSFLLPSEHKLKEEEQKTIENLIKALNENLSITSVLSYAMNYNTHITLDEIPYEQNGNIVNIGKIDSEFTLIDKKKVIGSLNWDGINFSDEETTINIAPVTMTFDQEVINGDIYTVNSLMTGDFTLLFNKINASSINGEEIFTLDHLSISANSEIKEELINIDIQYQVEAFKGMNQDLKDVNVDIAFNKLDSKTLLELNDVVNKFEQNSSVFPVQKLIEKASELLINNPEVIIKDLSAITSSGLIKSDMKIAIDNTLYDVSNPMSIIGALKANAKGNAPEAFFKQLGLEAMINMYVEHGFVVRKNDNLSFEALFNKGQLTVNGNIIPL